VLVVEGAVVEDEAVEDGVVNAGLGGAVRAASWRRFAT
jgi:hypothetical protein